MVHPGAIHPLTPGDPAYALLKLSAVGGLVGLRVWLSARTHRPNDTERRAADPQLSRPHPVSERKARRRKRRRSGGEVND